MSLHNFINARYNPDTDIYQLIRTDEVSIDYDLSVDKVEEAHVSIYCCIRLTYFYGKGVLFFNTLAQIEQMIIKISSIDNGYLINIESDEYECILRVANDKIYLEVSGDSSQECRYMSCSILISKQKFLDTLIQIQKKIKEIVA